ncbi:hypothetical protein AcV7_000968 [Taiwanofungus camphoratus]|nr:hypothetical protein AcW2_000551 [Antrodia cinnamomea]KAI0962031.1 hypothetical protein AcV7_000968 [Antrodia cinnamomea]KAI0962032.1 hypothetical protein AcV7_000968 [Antrodia cinnamomea]
MHGTTPAGRIITKKPTNDCATPQATLGCSLRLPNYRHAYSERYHPYGRQKRPGQVVDLMQTIDLRYGDVPGRPSVRLPVVIEDPPEEEALLNLANACSDSELRIPTPSIIERVRRVGLMEFVIDLAFVVRCRLQRLRAYGDRNYWLRLFTKLGSFRLRPVHQHDSLFALVRYRFVIQLYIVSVSLYIIHHDYRFLKYI